VRGGRLKELRGALKRLLYAITTFVSRYFIVPVIPTEVDSLINLNCNNILKITRRFHLVEVRFKYSFRIPN